MGMGGTPRDLLAGVLVGGGRMVLVAMANASVIIIGSTIMMKASQSVLVWCWRGRFGEEGDGERLRRRSSRQLQVPLCTGSLE